MSVPDVPAQTDAERQETELLTEQERLPQEPVFRLPVQLTPPVLCELPVMYAFPALYGLPVPYVPGPVSLLLP